MVNEKKLADISTLLPFIGALVLFNKKTYRVKSFEPVVGGVKMIFSNDQGSIKVGNGFGSDIIDVVRCRKWLEKNSKFYNTKQIK